MALPRAPAQNAVGIENTVRVSRPTRPTRPPPPQPKKSQAKTRRQPNKKTQYRSCSSSPTCSRILSKNWGRSAHRRQKPAQLKILPPRAKSVARSLVAHWASLMGLTRSRVSNEFSCKVTLDIVTSGYDNTERITQVLQDHIRNRRKLGLIEVSDADFSAHVIDPGLVTCEEDEIRCNDDTCVSGSARCNGYNDCYDGADEENCPDLGQDNFFQSALSSDCAQNISCVGYPETKICQSQQCDGRVDCPQGEDEFNCDSEGASTTPGITANSEATGKASDIV
ncbi:hypothetical protein evm_012611 [Chilo suppressalis]|nr:hypothetical protein evm_012611 [Chilo suppressalis]